MKQRNMTLKSRKKERIKINNIDDFKNVLKKEGYKINEFDDEKFKEEITTIFQLDNSIIDWLYRYNNYDNTTYKVNDSKDFIDYMEKMILFENEHKRLCKKISKIKKLIIDRIEYEREPRIQENVDDIIKATEEIKNTITTTVTENDKLQFENSEKDIDRDYLYSKDIELLKKMIIIEKDGLKEKYNAETHKKTISIEIPKDINYNYIPAQKGTVEYHEHLSNNIPRMQRLTKNIDKYIEAHEKAIFKLDQSKTLQGSINIALAIFDNKEFKAISGSNDIENYCSAPSEDKAAFKSSKVNKLGKLGIGYNRVNDSEKKILEEIHKQIEANLLKNEGNLILYSKWEPCPSCYYVISQFCEKHPNINVHVKYSKKYAH
jgi:regulator of replication initiation timing